MNFPSCLVILHPVRSTKKKYRNESKALMDYSAEKRGKLGLICSRACACVGASDSSNAFARVFRGGILKTEEQNPIMYE